MLTINGVPIPAAIEAKGPAAIDTYAREHGAYTQREQDPAQRAAVLAERAAAATAADAPTPEAADAAESPVPRRAGQPKR